ncbi:MAG: hypothetical protein QW478_06725 [Candidatus Micrarchaeaceae archaeon]
MALFGKTSSVAGLAGSQPVYGQNIISVGSTSLGATPVTINLPNIDSYNGNPIVNLNFSISVTDTTGSTAPSGVNSIESIIKKFSLQSLNGFGEPIIDFDGTYGEFTRWQRLINVKGIYVSAPTPADSAASTPYTATWTFGLQFYIPAVLFPLKPTLTLNTLASRTTGSTTLASSVVNSISVTADYVASAGARTRLKKIPISDATTGTFLISSYLDKNVVFNQFAFDFGADSNLNATNTFNLAYQGQQKITNLPYQNIINAENEFLTSSPHISGFFPFRVIYPNSILSNNTLNISASQAAAPSIGNFYPNTMVAYLQEAF